jgi:hypothetical protein
LRKDGFQALQAKATLLLRQAHLLLLLLPPPSPLQSLQQNKSNDHLWHQTPKTSRTPIWNLWFAR